MSDLIVIVYPNEAKAEEMRQKLLNLQKEYLIELDDAVIAVRNQAGHVKLNQLISTTKIGALQGSLWGLIIGTIFLMPVMGPAIGALSGAALGAASGAIGGALSDFGINDDFMEKLAASLDPGKAALFLLVQKMTADKVLEAIKGTGGKVLRTSLDHSKEESLREALEVAEGTFQTA
jgi:uncharacterized membrane protein